MCNSIPSTVFFPGSLIVLAIVPGLVRRGQKPLLSWSHSPFWPYMTARRALQPLARPNVGLMKAPEACKTRKALQDLCTFADGPTRLLWWKAHQALRAWCTWDALTIRDQFSKTEGRGGANAAYRE